MKYWERVALRCLVLFVAYIAIELAYICDKIYNGWPGVR